MERADFELWKAKEVARLLALVETERRYYQEMVAALPVPVVVVSGQRSVLWANRAFRRTLGLRSADLLHKNIDQVLPVEGLSDWLQDLHTRAAAAPPLAVQVGRDTFRITGVALRDGDDEADLETLLVVEQIAGPGALWNPVRSARAAAPGPAPSLSALPQEIPAVVWQADAATLRFRTAVGAVEELLGYPVAHWLGRAGFFEERMHPDDRAATMALYKTVLAAGGEATAEFRAISAAGEAVWCRETMRVQQGSASGVITFIGRRRQLEGQLLAAGRMEALQAFAGRLAHDLNNPLMIVAGYGEEMLHALPKDSPLRGELSEMLTATARISEVAARLGELARKHGQPPARVNLSALLPGLEARLARAAGAGVTLEMIPAAEPVWTSADASQLAEVIETLAGPEREGTAERTRLTVSWGQDKIAERTGTATLAAGRYARITLRDDGRGMEPQRAAAVFDPILSPASGGGLALARSYTLIRQWGGDIAFSSDLYRGSSFSIYLPYAEPEPAAAPSGAASAARAKTAETKTVPPRETILVVDDEAGIRGLIRRILHREHYQVVEAASAEEALEAAARHGSGFDLLLTDVMLPGMLGPELARRLYESRRVARVLYISGYTPDEAVRAGEYPPGARFLAKPFTLEALLGKVRETLDG